MVTIALLAVLTLSQDSATQVEQASLIASITQGQPGEREAALKRLVSIPPGRRSPAARRTLARELDRVNRLVEKRLARPGVVDSDWDTVDLNEYFALLVRANTETREVVALQPLIDAIGTGRMAVEGVAEFGNVAVEPLLAKLSDQRTAPTTRMGAARCLALLSAENQIGKSQLRRLDQVLVAVLSRPERFVVVAVAIDLAASVPAAEASEIVARIADNGSSSLVDDDALNRMNIQTRAKRALGRRQ